jgi:hypothetical protein
MSQCDQNAFADRRIVNGRIVLVPYEFAQGVHEIGAADDADQASIAEHRQAFDTAALHQFNDGCKRIGLADRPWLGRHHFLHLAPGATHVFVGKTARLDHEFQPVRPLPSRRLRA